MATFMQKICKSDFEDRPLPFRSREATDQQINRGPYVAFSSMNNSEGKGTSSRAIHDYDGIWFSSANKENVKSWLDSTYTTSALPNQQNVDLPPPTPSPICSPSLVSTPVSSPYVSTEQVQQHRHLSPAIIERNANETHLKTRFQESKLEGLTPANRKSEKGFFTEPPPGSPTGSTVSSGSEGGLLSLLASKLLSYKENGRRFSRYARESSGPIHEKHVVEDRSRKPPVEEYFGATAIQAQLRSQGSDMDNVGGNANIYRTASEAVSEFSIGSANGRTLSMEFDAMLAAAVATGIHQATTLNSQHLLQLPDIHEDVSVTGRMGPARHGNPVGQISERATDEQQVISDDEADRLSRALTVMRQGRDSEDMDRHGILPEVLASSRSSVSHGSRRGETEENNTSLQIVPTTIGVHAGAADAAIASAHRNRESSLESSSSGSYVENRLAMVVATHGTSPGDFSAGSSSSSSGQCKEKDMMAIVPIPASRALEKVRRDKIHAQAAAYQDAKSSKCNNRYKREESKITVWENQQKIKASLRMKKVEMRLEQKRAKALEKMQNEIARAHKTAEERKASAEAVRATKTARVVQEADIIRKTGKLTSTASVGCFRF